LPFSTVRCFRSELRRDILAFAARTSSAAVDGRSDFADFAVPNGAIIGVDAADARIAGCIFIGPVVGFLAGMGDNSVSPKLFRTAFTVDHGGVVKCLACFS
jgi:hypothetical protein